MHCLHVDGGADLDRALGLASAKSARIANPMLQDSGEELSPLGLERRAEPLGLGRSLGRSENVSSMLSSSDGLMSEKPESESESEPDESDPKPDPKKGPSVIDRARNAAALLD